MASEGVGRLRACTGGGSENKEVDQAQALLRVSPGTACHCAPSACGHRKRGRSGRQAAQHPTAPGPGANKMPLTVQAQDSGRGDDGCSPIAERVAHVVSLISITSRHLLRLEA